MTVDGDLVPTFQQLYEAAGFPADDRDFGVEQHVVKLAEQIGHLHVRISESRPDFSGNQRKHDSNAWKHSMCTGKDR